MRTTSLPYQTAYVTRIYYIDYNRSVAGLVLSYQHSRDVQNAVVNKFFLEYLIKIVSKLVYHTSVEGFNKSEQSTKHELLQ